MRSELEAVPDWWNLTVIIIMSSRRRWFPNRVLLNLFDRQDVKK